MGKVLKLGILTLGVLTLCGAAPAEREYFLISVGVDQYQDRFWPDLKWAASDASRVAASFGENTNFSRHTTLLKNAQASKLTILNALRNAARSAGPEDTIVFYVSSHGSLARREHSDLEPVLVLSETRETDLLRTGLTQREIMSVLETSLAKRKLLVFASCHSGIGKSKLTEDVRELLAGNKGALTRLEDVSDGSLVLAAAAQGESAREDAQFKGDIYTHFLLEALRLYDRNRDGSVTALEAHDYAKEKTFQYSHGKQRPTALAKFIGDADIVLTGKRRSLGLPVLTAYDENLSGLEVQVNGGIKGRLPLAFPLKPGRNEVTILDAQTGKTNARYALSAESGEEVSIGELLDPDPFTIYPHLSTLSWQDSTMERLIDAPYSHTAGLVTSYQWRKWLGSLQYDMPISARTRIWNGLESQLSRKNYAARFGYQHLFTFGLGIKGQAILGRETIALAFKDTVTSEKIEEESSAITYGVLAGIEYRFLPYLGISGELEWAAGKHDLGMFGELKTDRAVIRGGLIFFFGAKARKL